VTRVLALDTTAQFGSLALAENGEVVEEILIHAPDGFGTTLFSRIEALLARHDWPLESIDCFAAASGPGSFTGVRIGLTAVKGLAEALGTQAAAVSNLLALAACGSAPVRAAVIDARRGEVYGAVYDAELRAILPEVVAKLPDWLTGLPNGEMEFLSTDFTPFSAALAGTRFAGAAVIERRALAGAVARLAFGKELDPASVDANYVRRSDAELLWKDR
jgi:tRNA threonylcarbamoyladenosine biosynthesis protein TsaB